MMHFSEEDLRQYLGGTLPADKLISFDAHLAQCDACFERAADLRAGPAVAISLLDAADPSALDEGHLSYDQLASYVDGQLNDVDKEIANVHRRVCDECDAQINGLFSLRSTLALGARADQKAAESSGRSFLAGLWNDIGRRQFLRIAVPAFAVLLFGLIIWSAWSLVRTRDDESAKIVEAPVGESAASPAKSNVDVGVEVPANSNSEAPPASISLADGGRQIEIDADGNVRGLNAPQFENQVKAALTTQNIEIPPAARELRSTSGVLMGDGQPGAPFALTTPVGKIVEADRPQFRWSAMKDAEFYVVTIYDANFNKVAASPTLHQPSWTPTVRLKRDAVYQWQVTATRATEEIKSPVRPAPDAKFRVLDAASANEIASAKRLAPGSHLLLGIAYANAGLLDEATREFEALVRQNPNSEIAKKLLKKVRTAK